jgi:hypothetical protein
VVPLVSFQEAKAKPNTPPTSNKNQPGPKLIPPQVNRAPSQPGTNTHAPELRILRVFPANPKVKTNFLHRLLWCGAQNAFKTK